MDSITQGAVLGLVHHRTAGEAGVRALVGHEVIAGAVESSIAQSPVLQLRARLLRAIELERDFMLVRCLDLGCGVQNPGRQGNH